MPRHVSRAPKLNAVARIVDPFLGNAEARIVGPFKLNATARIVDPFLGNAINSTYRGTLLGKLRGH